MDKIYLNNEEAQLECLSDPDRLFVLSWIHYIQGASIETLLRDFSGDQSALTATLDFLEGADFLKQTGGCYWITMCGFKFLDEVGIADAEDVQEALHDMLEISDLMRVLSYKQNSYRKSQEFLRKIMHSLKMQERVLEADAIGEFVISMKGAKIKRQ